MNWGSHFIDLIFNKRNLPAAFVVAANMRSALDSGHDFCDDDDAQW